MNAPPPRTDRYEFGSTTLQLTSHSTAWLDHLARRYARFRGGGAHPFRVEFTPSGPCPDRLSSPLATFVEAPRITSTPTGFDAETPTTRARVDLETRTARLAGPCAAYPLDNLLRHLLPVLGEQGIIFHGAALTDGAHGVLACGPSGAGKSTLAKLVGERALCDELSAVRTVGSAELALTSLPYWVSQPGTVPARAVTLLRHASQHELRRLSAGDALRELSQQVLWPVSCGASMSRTFDHLSTLVEAVPVYDLGFAPRPDVWNFIEENIL